MSDRVLRFAVFAIASSIAFSGRGQDVRRALPAANSAPPPGSIVPHTFSPAPALQSGPSLGNGHSGLPQSTLERATLVDPKKKLAVGDQISVEIVEDLEGPIPRVVTATGDLEVPPLDRVHVAGKTTAEAAAEIKRKLEADYYYRATVKLSIDRVNPNASLGQIFLSGELRAPGVLQVMSGENLTVSGAVLRAGGFSEWANKTKVQITRKKGGRPEIINVNVRRILEEGRVDDDVILQDGDRVHVPKVLIRW